MLQDRRGLVVLFILINFFQVRILHFLDFHINLNEKTQFVAELSSDDYDKEVSSPKGFDRKNDLNVGIKYQLAPDFSVMGTLMHGDTIGLTGVLALNPRNSPYKSGIEPAPMPLLDDNSIKKNPIQYG